MTPRQLLLPILALIPLAHLSAASADEPMTAVTVASGKLAGAPSPHDPTIGVFKGIPYSRPPVGDLRWRPPQPQEPWSGSRRATEAGAPCTQPIVPETSIYSRGPMTVSEDCLYLNVWTGASAATTSANAKDARPVMVWYHGGANTTGHGSSLIFDGTRLARKGVVVVTVNYRMGAFGFLTHPVLTAESAHGSSGNYALLDQIAALRWVRENIGRFGGDPNRVTVFGQSAGALDVCLLMASPLARGLLTGVIAHSGGCLKVDTPLADAEAEGVSAMAELGIDATSDAAALRALNAKQLLGVSTSAPIVDGWVIPAPPRKLFAAGNYNRVPMIGGAMADEFRGLAPDIPEMPQEAYAEQVAENFPGHTPEILGLYAPVSDTSTREALQKMSTHSFFAWESRAWAAQIEANGGSAYVYHFSYPNAVFSLYVPERPEFPDPNGPRGLGAYHSGDLAYHFNNVGLVGLGWRDWDYALADIISSYWVNFAAHGDPNGANLPNWPTYQRKTDRVQEFGAEVSNVPHPLQQQLDLFDEVYAPP